ncbi:putative leucine-rich repeat-containing, plant-type, leucine-rich repeat domain, L [Rosa chinensis]|uniref:Putative leucine-rich repeat-containing, plant-type, leucine-rich repeat domain, L n=1 Tax=Rosa chinensis TaxID=74649 RepID=A0A2P6RGV3_ROSCH|nr:putative leucine-rich repeat-containing, plant-type, leucine-rich repeat domain, L [Rosa chinensis]
MGSLTFSHKVCSLACFTLYVQLVSLLNIAFASTSSAEADALLKWKANFQNQTQNNLTSWTYFPINSTHPKENGSPCNLWNGISCNPAGSVNKINLINSGIHGTLHGFSFLSFPNLEYLDLSLNGSIPREIGQLKFLYELALYIISLEGLILASLGNLSNLTSLYLYSNNLSGAIPVSLGNLSNLTLLYLQENQLSGYIPPEMGKLSNLVDLQMESNKLTGLIPPHFGNLKKLTYLYLYSNGLSGSIPP